MKKRNISKQRALLEHNDSVQYKLKKDAVSGGRIQRRRMDDDDICEEITGLVRGQREGIRFVEGDHEVELWGRYSQS